MKISRTAIEQFHRCPQQYRFQRIDKLPAPMSGRFMAITETLSLALTALAPAEAAPRILARYGDFTREEVASILWALKLIHNRGGEIVWINRILTTTKGEVELAAKLDAAIIGGSQAPLELFRWATGSRFTSQAAWLRIAASSLDTDLRPIAITELHLSNQRAVTSSPQATDVASTWLQVKRASRQIAMEQNWQANPGSHCSWCPYQDQCPAVG